MPGLFRRSLFAAVCPWRLGQARSLFMSSVCPSFVRAMCAFEYASTALRGRGGEGAAEERPTDRTIDRTKL